MESLLQNLQSSFKVDDRPNNPATAHPYFSEFYKCRNDSSNQAARRKEFLQAQKKKRNTQHNNARTSSQTENNYSMEWVCSRNKEVPFKSKVEFSAEMKNILMDSEWLVDVPEDLNSLWTAVVCPQGKRCTLVAQGKSTQAYDKAGRPIINFPSWLPSGSNAEFKLNQTTHTHRTILDCIYSYHYKTFYILDVLEWNSHAFYNCETNFRFYWLKSKLEEMIQLSEKSRVNPFSIKLAPRFPAAEIEPRMADCRLLEDSDPKVDGILFYHNETHYTSGSTPLVGWLKPFMVPEMLKVSVHIAYSSDIPPHYQTALLFIHSSLENQKQKPKGGTRKKFRPKEGGRRKEHHPSSNDKPESMEEDISSNHELPECCDNDNVESMDSEVPSEPSIEPSSREIMQVTSDSNTNS